MKMEKPAPKSLEEAINEAVARWDFGVSSAVKRGRDSRWPYIAIINRDGVTHNPMGRRAYATREEAVAAATGYIKVLREKLRFDLAQPQMRALREQHGLPRELSN